MSVLERQEEQGKEWVHRGQGCCRGDFRGESDIRREQQSGHNNKGWRQHSKRKDGQTTNNKPSGKENKDSEEGKKKKERGCLERDWAEVLHCRTTMSYKHRFTVIDGPTRYLPPTLPPCHLSLYWTTLHRVISPGSRKKVCVSLCVCVWFVQQLSTGLRTMKLSNNLSNRQWHRGVIRRLFLTAKSSVVGVGYIIQCVSKVYKVPSPKGLNPWRSDLQKTEGQTFRRLKVVG